MGWQHAIEKALEDGGPARALARAWSIPEEVRTRDDEAELQSTIAWLANARPHRLPAWLRALVDQGDTTTLAGLQRSPAEPYSLPWCFDRLRRGVEAGPGVLAGCALAGATGATLLEATELAEKLAAEEGWALANHAVIAEMVAWLRGEARPARNYVVVGALLVGATGARVCQLVLELVDGGGRLVPDARLALLSRNDGFRRAEEQAVRYAQEWWPHATDVRWLLVESGEPLPVSEVVDSSIGAALAAALRCLFQGIAPDGGCSVTATVDALGACGKVGDISAKLAAAQSHGLRAVVVSDDQAVGEVVGDLKVVRARSVDDVMAVLRQDREAVEGYLNALVKRCRPFLRGPHDPEIEFLPRTVIDSRNHRPVAWAEARAWNEKLMAVVADRDAGKTTLLQQDCRQSARDALCALEDRPARLVLPVFLHAGDLSERLRAGKQLLTIVQESLVAHLAPDQAHLMTHLCDLAQQATVDGSLRLYLDGLDEATEDVRALVASLVHEAQAASCHVIVASRPGPWNQVRPQMPKMLELPLEPFGDAEIRAYVSAWFAWHRASVCGVAVEVDDVEPRRTAARLWSELKQRPTMRELAGNPRMLALICTAFMAQGGTLPRSRGNLVRQFISLAMTGGQRRHQYRTLPEPRRQALRRLAQNAVVHGASIDEMAITVAARECCSDARTLLDDLLHGDGLLTCAQHPHSVGYQFTFDAVAQYLAAEELADHEDPITPALALLPRSELHGVVCQLAGLLDQPAPLLRAIAQFADTYDRPRPRYSDFSELLASAMLECDNDGDGQLEAVWEAIARGLDLAQRSHRKSDGSGTLEWEQFRLPQLVRDALAAVAAHGRAPDQSLAAIALSRGSDLQDTGLPPAQLQGLLIGGDHGEPAANTFCRWLGLRRLVVDGSAESQGLIAKLLANDPSPTVRALAARGLAQIGGEGAIEPLVEALDHDCAVTAENAAIGLGRLGRRFPREVVDYLETIVLEALDRLSSDELDPRVAGSIGAIEEMTSEDAIAVDLQLRSRLAKLLMAALERLLRADQVNWKACACAASGLGKLCWEPARDRLRAAVEAYPVDEVTLRNEFRSSACFALQYLRDPSLLGLFVERLIDGAEALNVRVNSASALGRLAEAGHGGGLPALVGVMVEASVQGEHKLLGACLWAISKHSETEVAQSATDLLRPCLDAHVLTRALGLIVDVFSQKKLKQLQRGDRKRSRPRLERRQRAAISVMESVRPLLEHGEETVCASACGALAELGDPTALEALDSLRESPHAKVRKSALMALRRLTYQLQVLLRLEADLEVPALSANADSLTSLAATASRMIGDDDEILATNARHLCDLLPAGALLRLDRSPSLLTRALASVTVEFCQDDLKRMLSSPEWSEIGRAFERRQIAAREVAEVVRPLLQHEADTVCASACGALAELGDPTALDALDSLRDSPHAKVRKSALMALRRLTFQLQMLLRLEDRTGHHTLVPDQACLIGMANTAWRLASDEDEVVARNAKQLFQMLRPVLEANELI